MKTTQNIDLRLLFGAHRQGTAKNGRPYNFIELSNGFKAELFRTDLSLDETKTFSAGDEVDVTIEIDPFNRGSKVVAIA